MHDVHVVPDALDGDLLAPHLHAAGCAAGRPAGGCIDRVGNPVVAHERAAVVVEAGVAIDRPARSARVGQHGIRQSVGIHADEHTEVVAEVVAEDHRLGTADEHRCGRIAAAAVSTAGRRAGGVVLDPGMRQPQVALMHFDHVEAREAALDRGLSAAVAEVGVVDAGLAARIDDDATPVPGLPDVGQVAVGVEGAARAEAVVAEAREDDRLTGRALGDELRSAAFELDAGTLQLHDHASVNRQPAALAGGVDAPGPQVAADAAVDEEVIL